MRAIAIGARHAGIQRGQLVDGVGRQTVGVGFGPVGGNPEAGAAGAAM